MSLEGAELLAIFFAFDQLAKLPLRVSRTLILAALIVLLDGIQDSLDGATARGALADLKLTGQLVEEFGGHDWDYNCSHGREPPKVPNLVARKSSDDIAWGSSGKDAKYFHKLCRLLSKANENVS